MRANSSTTRPKRTTEAFKMKASFSFFNAISSIFAVVFVILIWVQMAVAGGNPERFVIVRWNDFNEYTLEVVLFSVIGVLVIINAVWVIHNLKHFKK